MATPNYGYEKRQRELAKKNKKAEKLREKAERKVNPDPSALQGSEDVDGQSDSSQANPVFE